MRRFVAATILALVVGIAPGASVSAVEAAAGCDIIEPQAWWEETGLQIPTKVGHHVHLSTCWPKYGTILSGTVMQDVTVTVHELPPGATAAYLRAGWGMSGTIFYKRTADLAIPLDAEGNGSRSFAMPLDLRSIPRGSHEFRLTYDVRYRLNGTDREQFQTTGLQACVGDCSNPERAVPWYEGRSWYGKDGAGVTHNYQNARLRTDTSCLKVGGVCKVEMKKGSGGLTTRQVWASIDPRYHDGYGGLVLPGFPKAGEFSGNVTIPQLPSGTHKLVLVTSDGKNAVGTAFTFDVP